MEWLLFEKLKENYSLKRKKQPLRVIRENSCMLTKAETASGCPLKTEWEIGERNEGNDGNAGKKGGNVGNQGENVGN